MAVRDFKNGKDYLVFIMKNSAYPTNSATPPLATNAGFKLMACLNTNALSVTVDSIDTTTKCSDDWADSIPGNGSWEVSADGVAVSPDTLTEVSADAIFDFTTLKEVVWVAIFNPTKSTYRVGVAYFSSFGESFNNNESYSFSATLTGKGKLYRNSTT